MICRNVRNVLAPSIDAASSSSFGSDLKNWVMKKTPNTSARFGNAIPNKLSTSPIWLRIRNFGTQRTWPGIMMLPRIAMKITLAPGKFIRANA